MVIDNGFELHLGIIRPHLKIANKNYYHLPQKKSMNSQKLSIFKHAYKNKIWALPYVI